MAPQLLKSLMPNSPFRAPTGFAGWVGGRMRRDALIRFSAVVLAILTVATIVFAVINFQKEWQYPKPSDGVQWLQTRCVNVDSKVASAGLGERTSPRTDSKASLT